MDEVKKKVPNMSKNTPSKWKVLPTKCECGGEQWQFENDPKTYCGTLIQEFNAFLGHESDMNKPDDLRRLMFWSMLQADQAAAIMFMKLEALKSPENGKRLALDMLMFLDMVDQRSPAKIN